MLQGYIIVEQGNRKFRLENAVLNSGKQFIIQSLLGSKEIIYISHMLFGNGGYVNGEKKQIDMAQKNLFGETILRKKVIGQSDPEMPTQAIFSVILEHGEANNIPINEMALQLSNGELYSMSTFPDFTKTQDEELALSWYICY